MMILLFLMHKLILYVCVYVHVHVHVHYVLIKK